LGTSCNILVFKEIVDKRPSFIDESLEGGEVFEFVIPVEMLQTMKLFLGSHYGNKL
jgi:hypothetical protein